MGQTYQYKARDKNGNLAQGIMVGESENAVATKLKETGYIPVSVVIAKAESSLDQVFTKLKGVTFSDINLFTRQLFTLQKAGVPLLNSLNAIKEQAGNRNFKDILEQVIRDIEGGSSLSDALEKHPKVFNALYVNMVRSGEISGKLSEILDRLAILGEHEEMIKMRIQSATRYPLIIVATIIVAFLVLTAFVMPRFAKLYSRFRTELPLPTKALLWVHHTLVEFWWVILLVAAAAFIFLKKFVGTRSGRFWWDGFKLKIPVFGPLMFKLAMSRFSRSTGILIRSGVPILQILKLVSKSVGNVVIASTIDHIRGSVNEGKGMSDPMKVSGMFPPIVIQMVSVGEETGKIDELLIHVSDYYDAQIDHTIGNLVSLIEPILILFLGVVVLCMALGIFLPMWNIIYLFRR